MLHTVPNAWLGIEIRHLAALQAVAEERSFVRAGERLGYTQSAISNQIAALERLVAARLVERARGGGSVSLTPTGQMLYEHALALMERLQAARTDVVASWPLSPAPFRIGYFQSVGATVLPPVLRAFGSRFPDVPVELELGDAERLLQEVVAGGALDLAFVSAPLRVDVLGSVHLASDPFVLISPPDEAGAEPDFSTRALLAYKTCAVQRQHEDALVATGAISRSRIVCMEDSATIQGLVAAGCAYGLLPRLAVTSKDVAIRVLDGPSRELHLVWQRSRTLTDPLTHFVDLAQAEFAALGGHGLQASRIA